VLQCVADICVLQCVADICVLQCVADICVSDLLFAALLTHAHTCEPVVSHI